MSVASHLVSLNYFFVLQKVFFKSPNMACLWAQGAQTFFEQFRRTQDWHLGELKMASRRIRYSN